MRRGSFSAAGAALRPALSERAIRSRDPPDTCVRQPTTFLLTPSDFQDLDDVIMITSPLKKVKNSKCSDQAEIWFEYVFDHARHDGDAYFA